MNYIDRDKIFFILWTNWAYVSTSIADSPKLTFIRIQFEDRSL